MLTKSRQDAYQVGIHAEHRHHQHEREHAREDQKLHGRDPQGGQRIDFLVDLHRAQLGRKGRPRAPGEDDPVIIAPISRVTANPTRSAT